MEIGIKISELRFLTIGMVIDIFEEHQIDNLEQGSKDFVYVNKLDLQTGLNTFFPVG